ncbi:MAG: hypothetical protein JWQ05_3654 [Methylobacterium sp.]|jgi:hypothetical protein|nr:hypothetical protein [Methylobacterium sp.]
MPVCAPLYPITTRALSFGRRVRATDDRCGSGSHIV